VEGTFLVTLFGGSKFVGQCFLDDKVVEMCLFNDATGALVSLLVSLVSRDVSCCQQSHLAVFFASYGATLSMTG